MKPTRSNELAEPQAPGALMPDGSFKQDGGWVHQGPMHSLVMSMLKSRQAGKLDPSGAVSLVRSADFSHAFPNLMQWETCSQWWMAQTSTSAEAVVKYAGQGWKASTEDAKP